MKYMYNVYWCLVIVYWIEICSKLQNWNKYLKYQLHKIPRIVDNHFSFYKCLHKYSICRWDFLWPVVDRTFDFPRMMTNSISFWFSLKTLFELFEPNFMNKIKPRLICTTKIARMKFGWIYGKWQWIKLQSDLHVNVNYVLETSM